MKCIQKGAEPDFFSEWKQGTSEDWNPDWAAFEDTREKQNLQHHLINEQGGICCYCNRELRNGDCHTEHFKPRRYADSVLDYDNLFVSCQNDLQSREPRHCGMKKDDWFVEGLTVSPLDLGCEERFEYLADGRILADAADEGARETLNHLGLDIPKLHELRKAAIDAAVQVLEKEDNLPVLIDLYSRRSSIHNRFSPFCAAIVQVLKGLLH